MQLSYYLKNGTRWNKEDNILLPSKQAGETSKDYWGRCCQELIQQFNLPDDTTMVIK